MIDLRDKIRSIIEKETEKGHFFVLNTDKNVDLIQKILEEYEQVYGLKQDFEGLPKKAELIFVAAPTGAGKDNLVVRLNHKNPDKKYIELNLDTFRHYFPMFIDDPKLLTDKTFAQTTNEFAYEIYVTIQEILLQEFPGTNIIIPGTLRETDWVEDTFKRFKSDEKTDYSVRISCLSVPKKESAISIIYRYIGIVDTQKELLKKFPGTARFTTMGYHDETFERFPKNLEYFQKIFLSEPGKIIDAIDVYRRSKSIYDLEEETLVFSSDNKNGETTALDEVNKLRAPNLEKIKKGRYRIDFNTLKILVDMILANKEYLKSQGTLRDVIKQIALVLDRQDVAQRIDKIVSNENIR